MNKHVVIAILSLVLPLCHNLSAAAEFMQLDAGTPMQLSYTGGNSPKAVRFAAEELRIIVQGC